MKNNTKKLITCLVVPQAVGALSALITHKSMATFESLNQPQLTPPSWAFPVAWTVLFLLMGIASYFVLTADENEVGKKEAKISAVIFYGIQLIFNFLWTIIFFKMGAFLFALIWLFALRILIIITAVKFHRVDPKAGYIMIPYALWVSFAGYLNYSIYMMN